jgi:hypothetical protein
MDKFTHYRNQNQRYTIEEMLSIYDKVTKDFGDVTIFNHFLNQIYQSGYTAGSDSSDGSYSKSWENVR